MAAGSLDAVFFALGDPGRRGLLRRIAERGAATATELAAELPVTRQAVAKHLRALADAGLVRTRRSGRETHYELTPAPFSDAIAWMEQVGSTWDDRLAALGEHLSGR